MKKPKLQDKMLRPKLEDKFEKSKINRAISIIHPSRGRPKQALETAKKWLNKADRVFEYLMAIDLDDYHSYTTPEMYSYADKLFCRPYQSKTAIEAINQATEESTGDIMIIISDDIDCHEHWDTLILEAIGDKTDFCAKVFDGHQDWLITLPIMDRTYYNRFGYVYNCIYKHIYADLEMTCVAWLLDRYIKIPLTFEHKHPRYTGAEMDETYKRNLPTWITGKEQFLHNMRGGFGIAEPVNELPKMELIKQGITI